MSRLRRWAGMWANFRHGPVELNRRVAVETDPARVHALLGQHFEHLLREISRGLEKLAGKGD